MNFGEIRTAILDNGRFDVSQDAQIKFWVNAAYAYVWNSADFQFKKVTEAALTVTAGDDTPTLPSDFGDKLQIWDQFGTPLMHMDERQYENAYRDGKVTGESGLPEVFKVVNRVIYLAPTPSESASFTCSYTRRVCAFQTDGITVVPGGMVADTDVPLWDSAHHMVLVFKAMEIGGGLETDTSGIFWSELANDALGAMVFDLATVKKAPQQWGRPYR